MRMAGWCVTAALAAVSLAAQQVEVIGPGGRMDSPGARGGAEIPPGDYATLEGTVVDAVTGAPLGKASVQVMGMSAGRNEPAGAATDSGGRFVIDRVAPGRYRLQAVRNRYSTQRYGEDSPAGSGATLVVEKGQHLKNLDFKLTPAGAITGRVVDEDGEPAPYVQVMLMRYRYLDGRRMLSSAGARPGETNDLGEYRIFGVTPGKYYVAASFRSRRPFAGSGSGSDEEESAYPALYYPGVQDPSQTVPIEVRAGEERSGIDFQLRQARAVSIEGTVSRADGGPLPAGVVVNLMPRGSGFGFPGGRHGQMADPRTGRFKMTGVLPGSYVLFAMTGRRDERLYARLPLEVGGSDIKGAELALSPSLFVRGKMRFEEDAPSGTSLAGASVMLRASEVFPGSRAGRVEEDGSFEIEAAPGEYVFRVSGLPAGAYLKSARIGDRDALEQGLLLPGGAPSAIEAVVSLKAGRVSGVVRDGQDQPASGAEVVLIPEESQRLREDLFKVTTTDQYGGFAIEGVTPGKYHVVALDEVEGGAYRDPAIVEALVEEAEKVEVEESGQAVLELELRALPEPGG